MGIKANFTAADVRQLIARSIAPIEAQIVARLKRIGNQFVSEARQKADFTDRTGNLRSSIGYVIFKNGNQVTENFEMSRAGTDKATGEAKAADYAKEIASKYIRGFVLIVVAGMEYAAAVESKGKDVLTGSSAMATSELNKHFTKR